MDKATIILCGNKTDKERQVSTDSAEAFAKKENLNYFETSARTDVGIENMFYSSVSCLPFFEAFRKLDHNKLIEDLIIKNRVEGKKVNNIDVAEPSKEGLNIENLRTVEEIREEKGKRKCAC